jgi:hypothetical protein
VTALIYFILDEMETPDIGYCRKTNGSSIFDLPQQKKIKKYF